MIYNKSEIRTLIDNNEDLKRQFIQNKAIAYLDVLPTSANAGDGFQISYDDYLKDFELKDFKFVEGKGIIGQAVAKYVSGNFVNVAKEFNIENREFNLYCGIITDDEEELYINYGTYIVEKPDNKEEIDNTKFEAYDYMIKFNQPYVDRITYPCTLYDLYVDICQQAGVGYSEYAFKNSTHEIGGNLFQEGETLRDVLKGIAGIAFSWARIDENNVCRLDFNVNDNVTETLNNDYYKELSSNNQYGEINTIILRNSQVEGENYAIRDNERYARDGEIALVLEDNPFAYTQALRINLINAGSALYGLNYIPVNLSLIGQIYLNCTDKLRIKNMNEEVDTYYDTYVFDHTIKYDGTIMNMIDTEAMTETEVKYEFTPEMVSALKRTEISVDKQNQKITSVVEQSNTTTEKVNQLTQTVDELSSEIRNVTDITVTEKDYGVLHFEGINQSEPINIKIKPTLEDITPLYPRDDLYPSNSLFPYDRELIFKQVNVPEGETSTYIEYNLPYNLYFLNSNVYDEFILNHETEECYIIKRVNVVTNSDGSITKTALGAEQRIDCEFPYLPLNEGDYEVSMSSFPNAYLVVRLMVKNIYTAQYATTVQLNSTRTQLEDKITDEVSETITYVDGQTEEINSRITQTAAEINSTVSQKVGKTEIASTINQTAQGVLINANKINLQGYITATDLSGSGTTTINGANIKTGTISANRLDTSKINATTGSIGGFSINGTSLRGVNSTTGLTSSEQVAFWSGGKETQYSGHHGFEITRDANMFILNPPRVWLSNHHVPLIYTLADNFDGVGVQVNQIFRNENTYTFTFAVANSGTWSIQMNPPSDKKLKDNIEDTQINALDIIKKIKFRQFDWNDNYKKLGITQYNKHVDFGVIADELEEVNKDFIITNKNSDNEDLKTVRREELIYYNSKAIQELSEENKKLKNIIEEQDKKINEILKRLEEIENE